MSPARSNAARLSEAAPVFAALGDETRLHLVSRLSREGPLSIARLSEGTNVTRQAVSKHLQALADVGLVEDLKSGRERIYQLAPRRLLEAQRALERISAQWDVALERLRAMVEGE